MDRGGSWRGSRGVPGGPGASLTTCPNPRLFDNHNKGGVIAKNPWFRKGGRRAFGGSYTSLGPFQGRFWRNCGANGAARIELG